MLSEEMKGLIRAYVAELLSERRRRPLSESFRLEHGVRATHAHDGAFVDVPAGLYIVTNLEMHRDSQVIDLVDSNDVEYRSLVTRTWVGPTALGMALFDF